MRGLKLKTSSTETLKYIYNSFTNKLCPFLFLKVVKSTFCKPCVDPAPLYNGVIEVKENVAYYQCRPGFQMTDNIYHSGRKCTKAAKWEGTVEPKCKSKVFILKNKSFVLIRKGFRNLLWLSRICNLRTNRRKKLLLF